MCDMDGSQAFEQLQDRRRVAGSTLTPFLAMVSVLAACGLMIALVVMFERQAKS